VLGRAAFLQEVASELRQHFEVEEVGLGAALEVVQELGGEGAWRAKARTVVVPVVVDGEPQR
jgi:hypothetical protein